MTDTICALATPLGGAIAVIRISGPDAFSIVGSVCHGLPTAAPNQARFTRLYTPPSERLRVGELCSGMGSGEVLDEAIITTYHAPHSYTGEDSVEISTHGSPYIVHRLLDILIGQGCRMANPGEFTQRAYLNGKLDLSQAEAVADLIASTNAATHHIAISQLRGQFSSELAKLRDQLLHLTTLLELELDFSDHEDLEFADRSELLSLAEKIDARIMRLADSFQTGQALKEGVPVAIIGAPNVGKSTLLNALLGEERAIVSDIEGTTRDTVEDVLTIDGIQFRFIDTAGLRHTSDRIEQLGIDRSLQALEKARIILLMTEPGVPYPDITPRSDQTIIPLLNKADKPSEAENSSLFTLHSSLPTLHSSLIKISAKTGQGLTELKERLVASVPHPTENDIIVTSARHYSSLIRAHENLTRFLTGMGAEKIDGHWTQVTDSLSADLLAEDLNLVIADLGEITGQSQITPQETLNNIFSRFCVGK